ncbi:MAG: ChaN family lipoprotein [Oscillatoria sp. SIO1A7]|nr:ChaN family lipoprotein [Oscillatoria sp. SIO1A7]
MPNSALPNSLGNQMKICRIAKICAWWLGLIFSVTPPSLAVETSPKIAPLRPVLSPELNEIDELDRINNINLALPGLIGESLPTQRILEELAKADVVYLGEIHNSASDHAAQMEIIEDLHRRNPKIAIAMEMFQRPYQEAIDEYLSGELTESQLLEETEYETRWGFPWEYYAPILRYAKKNQLPVLAANTPREITKKVARNGLDSLTSQERQWIPPFQEIRTDNEGYRDLIREIYDQIHQGHGGSGNFDRFFLAQVLWDETMAEAIASFIAEKPDYQVVVLAGRGHIVYNYGIPSRVARRLKEEGFLQRTVFFSTETDFPSRNSQPAADFIWRYKE